MPPTKDYNKPTFGRSFSNNEMSMSARVFHQATNLVPLTPPHTPTGVAPSFPNRPTTTTSGWGRQTSQGGKYS